MGNQKSDRPSRASITRRQWLIGSTAVATALLSTAALKSLSGPGEPSTISPKERAQPVPAGDASTDSTDWASVRRQFNISGNYIHLAGMLLATHPKPVRQAISTHRQGLNNNPVDYLNDHRKRQREQFANDAHQQALEAAAGYLDMEAADIALVPNTTTGLAMVYNGLRIGPDQEVLTGHWNHWATEGSLQYRAKKTGFTIRRAHLYDDIQSATPDELVTRLMAQIQDRTRVVAVTWVHSVSGLKLPVGRIGRRIEKLNESRGDEDRILYCVDGVHGLGVEDFTMADLHCDFFVAGTHKWLFGPRGTGIVAARPEAWSFVIPTIPTFSTHFTPGRRFTPGGFHAFEHLWALDEAFDFHRGIGKSRIQARIHSLSRTLIDGLAQMPHLRLRTPLDPALSAGIVTFEVPGRGTYEIIDHLRDHQIIASTTPETNRIPRLSPGLLNTTADIDKTLRALRSLKA